MEMNFIDLNLTKIDRFVWLLNDSQFTSRKKAFFLFNNYCPIFSENRIGRNLVLTIVPYIRPRYFDLEEPETESLSLSEVVHKLAAHAFETCNFKFDGRVFSCLELNAYKLEMFLKCTSPNSHLIDYVDQTEFSGKALDLGCGIGANCVTLMKKNWEVTAIDLFNDTLLALQKKASDLSARANLIRGDITTLPFGENEYDLVLAIDILPYTPVKNLLSMMKKIYKALKPNGIFIATFFFLSASNQFSKHIMFMNLIGVEFLKDSKLPREILRNSGFEILKLNYRIESDAETAAIEVTAKKI